ncbi:TonB-dependent receptor [Rufibacter soli]
MVRYLILCALASICAGVLAPQRAFAQATLPDTVQLQGVTISANRYAKYAAGSRTQTVDSLLLQRQPGITLAQVLQQRSPLYLKSYGNGMTATVAFRGTTASHTAVLWNGFNIALPTLGLSDFALLPPSAQTNVHLQHGPSGALYGSGSVGGTVVLENPASFRPLRQVQVQQEVGSFGHRRSAVQGAFSNGRLALSSSFTRTAADNDFRFKNITAFGQPYETQQNAAFSQTSLAQDVHYKINQYQRVSVRGWYVKTERQIQPSMGSANTHARQHDENLRLMGEWQGQIARGTTTARVAYFKDRLDYQDDGLLSLSKVHTYQSQLEHERALLPNLLLQLGTEAQVFQANMKEYNGAIEEQRFSVYSWLRYDPLPRLQLSLNVRQAWVKGFNPPLTPTLGANYHIWQTPAHTLTAKGNVSRSYRVPTLNDRFWRPGGNPSLRPESGWGYEAGVAHSYHQSRLTGSTEATLYRLRVKDWIQWQPAPAGYSEPVNLQNVQGHGAELETRWRYQATERTALSAGAAYAYTISQQKLPDARAQLTYRQLFYVPKHKVAGWAEARFQTWWLSLDATITDRRFSDNDNNNWLPAYALANASLGKTFAWRTAEAQLMAHVQNITNTTYQTMAFRAMPPRTFSLSLALKWTAYP